MSTSDDLPDGSPDAPTPWLLAAFAAGALAVVGALAWTWRTDSPWLVVATTGLLVVLARLLLAGLRRLLADRPFPPSRARTWVAAGALALVALLVPLAVTSAASDAGPPAGSAQAAVRQFLIAVVDDDGGTACTYLTWPARLDFERPVPSGPTCESFFGGVTLRIGHHVIGSTRRLTDLRYRATAAGRYRLVTVTDGRASRTFRLRRATPAELAHVLAPPTPWRIASDVRSLG